MTDFSRIHQRVDGEQLYQTPSNFDPNNTGQVMAALGLSDEAINAAIDAERNRQVPIQQATAAPVELGSAVKAFENKKEIRCVPRWGLTPFLLSTVLASSSILLTGVAIGQNHADASAALPATTTAPAAIAPAASAAQGVVPGKS